MSSPGPPGLHRVISTRAALHPCRARRTGRPPRDVGQRHARPVPPHRREHDGAAVAADRVAGSGVGPGTDIRRPLGLTRDHPVDVLTRVAEYYSRTDQIVLAEGRIGGLRLEATDGPFRPGAGALVSGPTLALVMAMTSAAFLDDLGGSGVEMLRARC